MNTNTNVNTNTDANTNTDTNTNIGSFKLQCNSAIRERKCFGVQNMLNVRPEYN